MRCVRWRKGYCGGETRSNPVRCRNRKHHPRQEIRRRNRSDRRPRARERGLKKILKQVDKRICGLKTLIGVKRLSENSLIERAGLVAAVEQASDGIVITDANGKIQYVNPAFTAMTGYSGEEAVGQSARILKSGQNPAAFYSDLWNTIRSGRIWHGELINRRKDGTVYTEEMRITPVQDQKGEIVSFIAIKHDVTERRETEETLEFLAAIVESSDDAIIACTPEGIIRTWNPGSEAIFGHSAGAAVGKHLSILVVPERLPHLPHFIHRILQGHAISQYETVCLRQDGERIHVSVTGSPIRNHASAVVAVSIILRDISKRKGAENALSESEDRFRIMADGCPTLLWVTNAAGGNQFINRAYRGFTGTTYAQLEGHKWQVAIHPDDAAGYVEAFQRAVREQAPFSAEARIRRADGEWRWVGSYAEPRLSMSGEFLGHVGLSPDITERKRNEQALQFQHSLIRAIHEVSLDGILVVNNENCIASHNKRFKEVWQFPSLDIPDNLPDYVVGDQPPLVLSAVLERVKDPDAFMKRVRELNGDPDANDHCEIELRDGRAVERYSTSLRSEKGQHLGRAWFFRDVTKRKQAEQALQSSEEKFRQLAENIREVFWMMDTAATEILYVSPAYEQVWGQTCEGLYANPESWMHSIHPEDRPRAQETFFRQVQGEILENEYRIVQPSGGIRWIRDRAFPVRDRDGKIVRLAGVAEDTTDRKLSEFRLVHQARYDQLTDLPNRRLFREKLGQAIAECGPGKSGAVFFIDVDQFKLVNDTLGHSAGDQLLKEVAHRLLAACGNRGTLARFGGDEFTLVATGFERRESVRDLGDRLIRCLDEPFRIADRELFIGISVGISLFPENGTNLHVLQTNANVAMHEAKRAGKNRIKFFATGFADAARERLEMETRLRRALALSEFKLLFQPQFASGRSRPTRFEALLRWHPNDEQPVPPLKFIPLAEQSGLIVPIGTWVLREACRQCADWQTGDLKETGVAVNVSALQFACPDFVEIVARTLESTGLSPHLLELELTESVFVRDARASALTLTRLRNIGVTIALDDFGTGYSSLSYLQNLPIDALKIDRSFLTEAEGRPRGAAVVRCVVELAHALALRVIGEGVETTAQLDLLASLGCDEIQGFLLGSPSFDVAGASSARTWNPVNFGTAGDLARLRAALIDEAAADVLSQPQVAASIGSISQGL